ncbi:hypothetical protein, partial [Escherichia coli]|uniref:hypothetical protein n=1 Tax=Escherichia coli TaxID=562 RepID=UPI001B8DA102
QALCNLKNILAVGDNRTTRKRIAYTDNSLSTYRKPYSRRLQLPLGVHCYRQCDWETWHHLQQLAYR